MFKMGREKRGPLALEAWARQLTDGYPNVSVDNMTTSWRNGLAFCALIHRFRPDLIDYDKLDPSDIIGNCSYAFETAESKLGIPALLDPEDMAAHEVPDRLSVLTYVAQFYSLFKNAEKKSTVPTRRQKDDDLKTRSSDKSTTPNSEKTSLSPTTNTTTAPTSSVLAAKRRFELPPDDLAQRAKRSALLTPPPCSKCQNPVYISERTVFMKKLYHRKCFRCHGCSSMLNPHTADVSADGTSFFCLAKSCQLELLKHNRSGSGVGNNNSFSSSPTSQAPPDPSLLLVRNLNSSSSSLVSSTTESKHENGHHEDVQSSSPSPQPQPSHHFTAPTSETEQRDKESKENVVPLRNKNDVGGGECDDGKLGGGGRVSRLTARFECVQDDSNKSGSEQVTTSSRHGQLDSSKSDDSRVVVSIIRSRPNYELPGDNVVVIPGDITTPAGENLDVDKDSKSGIIMTTCGDNNDVEMVVPVVNIQESKSGSKNDEHGGGGPPKDKYLGAASPLMSARSNWLRGQIEKEEEEDEPKPDLNESNDDNKKLETISIPDEIPSPQENNANPEIDSKSISIEFKLSDDDDNDAQNDKVEDMDVEENVGDSGISEISSIEPAAASATVNMEKTEDAQILSEKKHDEEDRTVQLPPGLEGNNFPEDETGTSSSSAIISPDPEDNPEEEPLSTTPKPESEVIEETSHNPFGEDEENKVDQVSENITDPPEKIEGEETEPDPVVETKNATGTESPVDESVSSLVPSPSPSPSHEQVQTEKLTPTPRKKKRAPQPSPLLMTSPQPEPGRPMPSPRTKNKKLRNSLQSSNVSVTKEEYPSELNPFGDEEESGGPPPRPPTPKPRPKASSSINPFEDEEEDETLEVHHDGSIITIGGDVNLARNSSGTNLNDLEINNNSNGGGPLLPPKPTPRSSTPSMSKPYNPFEDEDDDIGEYHDDKPVGVVPRGSHDDTSSISSKTSDLSNTSGVTGGYSSQQKSFNASELSSLSGSTKLRSRKSHRAPLPPGLGPPGPSGPSVVPVHLPVKIIPPPELEVPISTAPPSPKKVIPVSPKLKVIKDNTVNKTQYRKKRRAPPPRRRVEPLPEEQIKTELSDLEIKQRELERQGISLEGNIRQLMCQDEQGGEESKEAAAQHGEQGNSEQLDEMIIQLWNIVNEKNDILRRQTELEYLRRSHRLEEMQADFEFQLRILMDTPLDQRLEDHEKTEQQLLDELLKLVDERNEVVDWLDYYRQMDREEEMHVTKSLQEFKSQSSSLVDMVAHLKIKSKKDKKKEEKDKAKGGSSKSKSTKSSDDGSESSSKPVKKKESFRSSGKLGIFSTLRKKKKSKTVDEDKDIDESVDK